MRALCVRIKNKPVRLLTIICDSLQRQLLPSAVSPPNHGPFEVFPGEIISNFLNVFQTSNETDAKMEARTNFKSRSP